MQTHRGELIDVKLTLGPLLHGEPCRIKKRFSQVTYPRDRHGAVFPFHVHPHLVNTRSVLT